jgi:hypothetical protein
VEPFWLQVDEGELRQGDYPPGCSIPIVGPTKGEKDRRSERVFLSPNPISAKSMVITDHFRRCDLDGITDIMYSIRTSSRSPNDDRWLSTG